MTYREKWMREHPGGRSIRVMSVLRRLRLLASYTFRNPDEECRCVQIQYGPEHATDIECLGTNCRDCWSREFHEELKTCPFCGSVPVIHETSTRNYPNGYSVGYNIECPNCHIYFGSYTEITVVKGLPVVKKNGYQECIDMWNRRFGDEQTN